MDHLLQFSIARDLWDVLLCIYGVSWEMPSSVLATLESWEGTLEVWGTAPSYLMCCIWNKRNHCTLERIVIITI